MHILFPVSQTPDSTHVAVGAKSQNAAPNASGQHQVAASTVHSTTSHPAPRTTTTAPASVHTTTASIRTTAASRTAAPAVSQQVAAPAQTEAAAPALPQIFFYDTSQHPETTQTEDLQLLNIDSIFASVARPAPVEKKSLFTGHSLSVENPYQQPHIQHITPNWTFCVLLLLVALISWFLNSYRFRITDVLQASVSMRGLNRLFRENNFNRDQALLPMALVYVASLALLVYYVATQSGNMFGSMQGIVAYLVLLACCFGFYFVRNGLTQLFGVIFENAAATSLYLSNTYIYNFLGGVVLTPALFFVFYTKGSSKTLLIILAVWLSLLFIMRLVRGLQLILTNAKTSKLYLFYYLCIFEIVPILVLAKLLISY